MIDRLSLATAENRFGLGARPDHGVPGNPRPWLEAQLDRFEPRPPQIAAAGDSSAVIRRLIDYREQRRAEKPGDNAASRRAMREAFATQALARISEAVETQTPFMERLVAFWSNHFAISVNKPVVRGLGGLIEFEAIRPNLGGRFIDLWLAVMRHPAMLLYLDQAPSIGPNSTVALMAAQHGRVRGLNENLAREAMELHSLGVRSGYSQGDVAELARALTGWSIGGLGPGPATRDGQPGLFAFFPAMHEPGERIVLGRRYAAAGERQAVAILSDLAARPETARHIATKLVRHFIADEPPAAAVARLAAVFAQSGGSLPAIHRALIALPEAWQSAPAKFKTPYDWLVSALRGVDSPPPTQRIVGTLAELGQPLWQPGAPAGWPDLESAWAGPDALLRRVLVADRIGALAPATLDARSLATRLVADVSARTASVIASASTPGQALALLLVAPEFQRR